MKAILFDLGGTLIKTAPIPQIIKRMLDTYGVQRSITEIARAHRQVESQLTLEDYILPFHEFWFLWNVKILKILGVHANTETLAEAIAQKWWDNADLQLFPDVKETLKNLKEMGIKMGIVTNGFQSDIDEILARTSLTGFFDVAVGVDAVGKPKPSKEIFLYALEKLGVHSEETLFVGDDLRNDYEGAEKAGLKALLIDREDIINKEVRKIRDLRDLTKYVDT